MLLCDYKATHRKDLKWHVRNAYQKRENVTCTECNIKILKHNLIKQAEKLKSREMKEG